MSNTVQPSVHLGFPNTADLEVSEFLKNRGIDLLRASPSDLSLVALRDFIQLGYDDYIGVLPAFMLSMSIGKPVSLAQTGFTIKFPATAVLPLPVPPVILSFDKPIQEVLDSVRGKDNWEVTDYRSGRASGLEVRNYSWTDIANILQYKSDKKCPVTDNRTNPSTLPYALMVNKIASSFISLHTYPSAHDASHYANLEHFYHFEEKGMDGAVMQVDDGKHEAKVGPEEDAPFAKIYGDRMRIPAYKKGFAVKYKGTWTTSSPIRFWYEMPNELVAADHGLFFPYVSELQNYDSKKVIEVIERRFLSALGSDPEEIMETFEMLRSEWGVLGKTEYGKQMSHLYTCIELAVEGQAQCRPFLDNGNYKGVVLVGTGYTVNRNGKIFRPVDHASLTGAIVDSGSNTALLRKMCTLAGVPRKDIEKTILAIKTMGDVRSHFILFNLDNDDRSAIIGLARQLSFNEVPLGINPSSFERVASYITDLSANINELPIHYSMILNPDRVHVIWSAFGSLAPSFRIQSGTRLNLTKSWKGKTVTREGGTKQETTGNVVRIACNNVVLKKAIQDLDDMRVTKEVLNPLAKAGAKRSQFNQMRFFDGKDFDRVVASLRVISDASLVDDNRKRKRDEDGEDIETGPSKKRGALDLD